MLTKEAENKIFKEFFSDWNTTVTISKKLYPQYIKGYDFRMKKKVEITPKKRGRVIPLVVTYYNQFKKNGWLDYKKMKLSHLYKSRIRERTTRCYRGNLNPFFEYAEKEIGYKFAKSEKRFLELLFEIPEIRKDILRFPDFVQGINKIIQDKLILTWLKNEPLLKHSNKFGLVLGMKLDLFTNSAGSEFTTSIRSFISKEFESEDKEREEREIIIRGLNELWEQNKLKIVDGTKEEIFINYLWSQIIDKKDLIKICRNLASKDMQNYIKSQFEDVCKAEEEFLDSFWEFKRAEVSRRILDGASLTKQKVIDDTVEKDLSLFREKIKYLILWNEGKVSREKNKEIKDILQGWKKKLVNQGITLFSKQSMKNIESYVKKIDRGIPMKSIS